MTESISIVKYGVPDFCKYLFNQLMDSYNTLDRKASDWANRADIASRERRRLFSTMETARNDSSASIDEIASQLDGAFDRQAEASQGYLDAIQNRRKMIKKFEAFFLLYDDVPQIDRLRILFFRRGMRSVFSNLAGTIIGKTSTEYLDDKINHSCSILGLSPDISEISPHQLKNAYRIGARKYHTDKNGAIDAEKKFKEVVNAYNFLTEFVGKR